MAQKVLAIATQTRGAVDVQISQENTSPELRLHIDRQRAADVGVSVSEIATTLQVLVAGGWPATSRIKRPHLRHSGAPAKGRTNQKDTPACSFPAP